MLLFLCWVLCGWGLLTSFLCGVCCWSPGILFLTCLCWGAQGKNVPFLCDYPKHICEMLRSRKINGRPIIVLEFNDRRNFFLKLKKLFFSIITFFDVLPQLYLALHQEREREVLQQHAQLQPAGTPVLGVHHRPPTQLHAGGQY